MKRLIAIVLYHALAKHLPNSFFPLGALWNAIRISVLKRIFPIGENTKIQQNVQIGKGKNICIGSNCQINENVKLQRVEIGDYVMIAPGTTIIGVSHNTSRLDMPMILQGETEQKVVKIEDDVWIGTNAIILPGITVARGCIIGAGAVVTKDCLPFGVYGGVPARRIKDRQ